MSNIDLVLLETEVAEVAATHDIPFTVYKILTRLATLLSETVASAIAHMTGTRTCTADVQTERTQHFRC